MQIIWLGQGCFKILAKDEKGEKISIIFDPSSKIKTSSRFSADIVLMSHDLNEVTPLSIKATHILNIPGEYEIRGFIFLGKKIQENIIWRAKIEEITLAHLGAMKKIPSDTERAFLTAVEILIVPVGDKLGGNTKQSPEYKEVFKASEAAEVARSLEPKIIIPCYFTDIKPFCQESLCPSEELDKLVLRKKDIPTERMKMVILNPLK